MDDFFFLFIFLEEYKTLNSYLLELKAYGENLKATKLQNLILWGP